MLGVSNSDAMIKFVQLQYFITKYKGDKNIVSPLLKYRNGHVPLCPP